MPGRNCPRALRKSPLSSLSLVGFAPQRRHSIRWRLTPKKDISNWTELGKRCRYSRADMQRVTKRFMSFGDRLKLLASDLKRVGWCRFASGSGFEAEIVLATDRTAELLGRPTAGRAGATRETIVPCVRSKANPRSQSAAHGLDILPLHAELCHRPIPCRYVVLGCVDPGKSCSATTTLDWRTLRFTSDEMALLKGAPLLVRNGRKSFYSTAIPSDERFFRYDGECIEAVDVRGRAALAAIHTRLSLVAPAAHRLQRGDILVIDNWRILHGREAVPEHSGRRLTRRLVNA